MMGIQTKKELMFFKIIAVGMPIIFCIVILFFGLHIWWAQKLSNPVTTALEIDGVSATICGISISELESIKRSFDEITTFKISGSHPLNLQFFIVETSDYSYSLQLGRDSRDAQLFWVYPEEGQMNTVVGGWIKSKYIAEKYADCL
jgi:hypothetical protein